MNNIQVIMFSNAKSKFKRKMKIEHIGKIEENSSIPKNKE